MLDRLRSFLSELKRRNVYRVAGTYLLVAFVGIQAVQLLIPSTTLPPWADELLLAFLIAGFPVSLVVAWAFELTPDGVSRTPEAVAPEGRVTESEGRERTRVKTGSLVALGLLAAAALGGWYLSGAGGPEVTDRSIAVLPFEELGGGEPGVFTEGVHDDLLTRLSNIAGLDVISRTAVRGYRGTDMTTGQIADELGVRWVLEGGVQEMEDQLQVNAQLIDPRTEMHVWADSYRRDLTATSLFDLQSEITKRIAEELETRLTAAEEARVERVPTEDLTAYRLYVRGRTHLDSRDERGTRRAIDAFRRALRRDSSYALAWSGLADALALSSALGYVPQDSALREAADAARRSVALDDDLAEAHASMGLIHMRRREGPASLAELRRAVELKPSYAQAQYWLGLIYEYLGRTEDAHRPLTSAVSLDPRSPVYRLGLSEWYLQADSVDRALEEARTLKELGGHPVAPSKLGEMLSITGRHDEALATLRSDVDGLEPGSLAHTWARLRLVHAHARAGNDERARTLLAAIEGRQDHPINTAGVFASLGDRDSAFADLARALPGAVDALRYDPDFAPLRDDPRWEDLLRETNLAWGLTPDGRLPADSGARTAGPSR